MHEAIVTRIRVTPHPDPEVHSLAVGYINGETIIVSNSTKDGDLGLYFPCDLQLSESFAKANDLVRRKNPDGTNAGGMFDENRKVRAQKFRGVKSNGFWCPLSYLTYLGDVSSLQEGDKVASFMGTEICRKYFTPQALRQKNAGQKNPAKETIWFPKHKDTEQLRHSLRSLKAGDRLVITNKVHGTSQRVAKNYEAKEPKFLDKILGFFGINRDLKVMRFYNGTRNVVLRGTDTGFYSESFREKVAAKLYPFLEDHMEVFFEVVGWEVETRKGDGNSEYISSASPIMPRQDTSKTKDKEVKKLYGDKITYKYGCQEPTIGELYLDDNNYFGIYVYRIAYVLPNGAVVDLTWDQVKEKCTSWGIKHVPELDNFVFDGRIDDMLERVSKFTDGPDVIDSSHPREGVCVRVDSSKWQCYKDKSFLFKVLEGIAKENDEYVDMEEVS